MPMDTQMQDGHAADQKDTVARALGWFSLGLGTAQIAAPRVVERLIGLNGDRQAGMRLLGAREVASGVGILAQRRPTPWLWARVAGDAMDLALLGRAFRAADARKARVAGASAAVAGVMIPDVLESLRTTTSGQIEAKGSITVRRPVETV